MYFCRYNFPPLSELDQMLFYPDAAGSPLSPFPLPYMSEYEEEMMGIRWTEHRLRYLMEMQYPPPDIKAERCPAIDAQIVSLTPLESFRDYSVEFRNEYKFKKEDLHDKWSAKFFGLWYQDVDICAARIAGLKCKPTVKRIQIDIPFHYSFRSGFWAAPSWYKPEKTLAEVLAGQAAKEQAQKEKLAASIRSKTAFHRS